MQPHDRPQFASILVHASSTAASVVHASNLPEPQLLLCQVRTDTIVMYSATHERSVEQWRGLPAGLDLLKELAAVTAVHNYCFSLLDHTACHHLHQDWVLVTACSIEFSQGLKIALRWTHLPAGRFHVGPEQCNSCLMSSQGRKPGAGFQAGFLERLHSSLTKESSCPLRGLSRCVC